MMDDLNTLADRVEAATGPDRAILGRLDMSGDCWLWTGALDERGRGRVWRNGKLCIHHRAIWEILIGPIPKDAKLCHDCDNPTCGNPAHLYVGDSKTNAADMVRRGRHWTVSDPKRATAVGKAIGDQNTWAKGVKNPKAKLTPAQVSVIATSHEKTKKLAEHFGVNRTTIQRIRSGTSWA